MNQQTPMTMQKEENPHWETVDIPNEDGLQFLFMKLGPMAPAFEAQLFYFARQLSNNVYDGGMWQIKVLPNGSFYYALEDEGEMEVIWNMNYFHGRLSIDAFSIAASVFALTILAEQTGDDAIITLCEDLRLHALSFHPEQVTLARLFD